MPPGWGRRSASIWSARATRPSCCGTEAAPFKIEETYALDAAEGLLKVEITAERRRFGGEVHLKRVYRRVDGPTAVD